MKNDKLIEALLSVSVETGSLACLGCGHEHNCGIQGCAILREVAERYTALQKRYDELNDFEQTQCANLLVKLAEKDKQLAAAVEDLHRMHSLCMAEGGCCSECGGQNDALIEAACDFCIGSGVSCWVDSPDDESRCAAFVWRGPQEAREVTHADSKAD